MECNDLREKEERRENRTNGCLMFQISQTGKYYLSSVGLS